MLSILIACLALPLWAADLNARFERRLTTETEDLVNIKEGIAYLQRQQAETNGRVMRGTHAKGVCAKAEFEIFDLSERAFKHGLFSAPGRHPTTVRFANADGKVLADQEPDVRALSLAVETPAGRRDFALNNATTFPINDAHVFADLMVIARYGIVSGGFRIGVGGLLKVREAFNLGELQKSPARDGYQMMRYWSGVPFQLGDEQAVKYSLKPCAGNLSQPLTADPNTLTMELKRHLSDDTPGCFEFQVQVLDAARMTDAQGVRHAATEWVENANWEWNEDQAPFRTVGVLRLQADSILSDADCERLQIDVTRNVAPEQRGLGSLNRARASGEQVSARNRQ